MYCVVAVSSFRGQSGKDLDVAVEGALGQVEGAALQRVLCEVARTIVLALQLDLRDTGKAPLQLICDKYLFKINLGLILKILIHIWYGNEPRDMLNVQ